MEQSTKDAILARMAKALDDIDEVMSKVDDRYQQLQKQTQEYTEPKVNQLKAMQEHLGEEYTRLSEASEDTYEAVTKEISEYANSFIDTFRELQSSREEKDDVSRWRDIPPPDIQLGYPNPPVVKGSEPDPQDRK